MIFPSPKTINETEGYYRLGGTVSINFEKTEFNYAADFLTYALKSVHNIESTISNNSADITFVKEQLSAEEYTIRISENGIIISEINRTEV